MANVLTIDRMSALQSRKVKTISTADDDVELSDEEQVLLDQASGKVLLFQLAGPMIFGVAKAISREHNAIGNCQAVGFRPLRGVPPGGHRCDRPGECRQGSD